MADSSGMRDLLSRRREPRLSIRSPMQRSCWRETSRRESPKTFSPSPRRAIPRVIAACCSPAVFSSRGIICRGAGIVTGSPRRGAIAGIRGTSNSDRCNGWRSTASNGFSPATANASNFPPIGWRRKWMHWSSGCDRDAAGKQDMLDVGAILSPVRWRLRTGV